MSDLSEVTLNPRLDGWSQPPKGYGELTVVPNGGNGVCRVGQCVQGNRAGPGEPSSVVAGAWEGRQRQAQRLGTAQSSNGPKLQEEHKDPVSAPKSSLRGRLGGSVC